MKFNHLPLHAKKIILDQFGERIGDIEEDGNFFELYLLNDFYVEIAYQGAKVLSIEKLDNSHRLLLYCPELDL